MAYQISRNEANRYRKLLVKQKGTSDIDRKLITRIKNYSRSTFGTTAYWPWLALYTEIRGEFLENWIPCDYFRYQLLPIWNSENELSSLKTFDFRLFEDFALKPLAVKIGTNYYDSDQNRIGIRELNSKIRPVPEIVIKSDGSSSGKAVKFISNKDYDDLDFSSLGNVVIQPSLKQHRVLQELNSSSVNTLRIITYLDETGKVTEKCTVLRFGVNGARVDNTSYGGYFLYLNRKGNVISDAYDSDSLESGDRHPNTDIKYSSLKIPSVEEAIDSCCKAHHRFPYVKIIAWDVAISSDGTPVLLEWNTKSPSIWHEEAYLGPLWPELEI